MTLAVQIKDLWSALNRIHEVHGRAGEHGSSPEAYAACTIDAILSLKLDMADLEYDSASARDRIEDFEGEIAELEEKLASLRMGS